MRKIAVMSGKGGVGKSSVSVLLASVLAEKSSVLILDFDICGPSCVRALGVSGEIKKLSKGLEPLKVSDNLYLLSMGLMIKENESVIWRGPKKVSLLNLFYESIEGFDYIICDMPPGISEEHEFIIGKDFEVVFVTTSQNIALQDTLEAVNFCKTNNLKTLGVIENMSGYRCECCNKVNNIFAAKGGSLLAASNELRFLCALPIEREWSYILDKGIFMKQYKDLQVFTIIKEATEKLFFKEK